MQATVFDVKIAKGRLSLDLGGGGGGRGARFVEDADDHVHADSAGGTREDEMGRDVDAM